MSGNNKIIGFATGIFAILAVGVFIANNSAGPSESEDVSPPAQQEKPIPQHRIPEIPTSGTNADADSSSETLKKVSAQLAAVQDRVLTLNRDLQNLQKVNDTSGRRDEIGEIKNTFEQQITNLTHKLDALSRGSKPASDADQTTAGQNLTPYVLNQVDATAFGFVPGALGEITALDGYEPLEGASGYVRVSPLYSVKLDSDLAESDRTDEQFADNERKSVNDSFQSLVAAKTNSVVTPVASIPQNSTLYNSTAFTALVGRVPIGGSVSDPMPVKIIIGSDNLVANGHRISGLKGTIFSGTAVGDWTLSCVRVNLYSATFVFDDGSFTTLNDRSLGDTAQDNALGTGGGRSSSDGNPNGNPIGWLSDNQGVPCIAGKKLSDAPKRLSILSILGLAKGASESYAEAQQTVTQSQGTTTSALTGSNARFLAGNTVAGGIDSVVDEIQGRFRDSFDAIYVPAGESVVVNISRTLPINKASHQRKLNYSGETNVQILLD